MALKVSSVGAFSDNYIWVFGQDGGRDVCIVDPGDAAPVLAALYSQDLQLSSILLTHHHADHIGGVKELLAGFPGTPVYGPKSSKIDSVTSRISDGDKLYLAAVDFSTVSVPGHTLDHIAYYASGHSGVENPKNGVLFCGDTLFAGGCGRIFEGNPAMMYKSLVKLASLPGSTMVYCAHEYTQANLRFAIVADPGNPDTIERLQQVNNARNAGISTVPSMLSMELRTNPFLRCHTRAVRETVIERMNIPSDSNEIEVFAALRRWKDSFIA